MENETVSQGKVMDKLHKDLQISQVTQERRRVALFRENKQMQLMSEESANLECKLDSLEAKFSENIQSLDKEMSESLQAAKNERDDQMERISDIETRQIATKEHDQNILTLLDSVA